MTVDPIAPTQPAPRALPAPCVAVTLYPAGGTMREVAARCRVMLARLARVAAPGDLAAVVHDPINGDEKPLIDLVAEMRLRLWSAYGANPLVKVARTQGITVAAAAAETYARSAARAGAEVIEPNGERVTRYTVGPDGKKHAVPNPDDWIFDAPGDRELLPDLAREVIAACRRGAPRAAVSWTSHDILRYHPLPWGVLLGVSGVDLHAPQVYVSDPEDIEPETHVAARSRLASHSRDVAAFVRNGVVRADLAPGGAGWTPYGQLHGLTASGAAIVLDAADTVRAWALPARCDDAGLDALEAVLLARRETGRRAGAIARLQDAHGLAPDGVLGRDTLALVARLRGS